MDTERPHDIRQWKERTMASEYARGQAAQCWCDESTKHLVLDATLAEVFATKLDALLAAEREACAGIATMHAKRPQTKREHWLCDASWQAIQDERRGEDIASVEIAVAIRGMKP